MDNVAQLLRQNGFERPDSKPQLYARVFLLGDVRATAVDGANMLPLLRKSRALLAYLCLSEGERLSRSRVAGKIWDRATEANARESLRHAIFSLIRLGWRVDRDHESIKLDMDGLWVDAFETPGRPDLLLRDLHGIGPSFDGWLAEERARYEKRWRAALSRELEAHIAQKVEPELRAESARKLLNVVETDEVALRNLMVALVDLGDSASAIREFERFRLMLEAAYHVHPSDRTGMLAETIRLQSRPKASRPAVAMVPRPGKTAMARYGGGKAPAMQTDSEPSIAVLPFRSLTLDRRNAFVADGLVEDLVETISRVPGLLVVSRLSTATFKHHDRSPQEIGEALGVRYALAGSVRIVGDFLRLSVELVDTTDHAPLWVASFTEKLRDLLEMQDQLAAKVVRTVAPQVRVAELKRIGSTRPEDQTANDLFLRAQELMHQPTRQAFEAAEPLFRRALDRQPQYAKLLAWFAHWYVLRVGQAYSADPQPDTMLANRYAQRAIECDENEPLALAVQGHIAAYLHKDFRRALASFDAALEINANAPRTWLWRAYVHSWLVEGAQAVEDINRAIALTPYDPLMFLYSGAASIAYIAASQYGRAIEAAWRCVRENPSYTTGYKSLVVALVLCGRASEAQAPVQQLRVLEPSFTLDNFRRRSPAYAGPRGEVYCQAFAAAGIPPN